MVQAVPQHGYSRGQFAVLVGGLLLTIGMVGLAIWLGVTHYAENRRLAAIREAQERQQRIQRELYTLQAQNPTARFALYPGDGHSVALDTAFSTCLVRRVDFARDGDTLNVTVGMEGIRKEDQAPLVNVSVYDEDGALIARSAIVKYLSAELGRGDTRDVEDRMQASASVPAVFLSIDERQ